MVAFFLELSSKFNIAKIHFVLLGDMLVEVLVVGFKLVKGVIVEFAFVLVVVHLQLYKSNQ